MGQTEETGMKATHQKGGWIAVGALLVVAGTLLPGLTSDAADDDTGARVKPVFAQGLPNAPGKELTAVVVTYAPGGKSPQHHHAGSVFAYVLSGAIRSENSATGPAKVYHAGEAFFEPPGSEHLISENVSVTEPASMLAVFVAERGAHLTAVDR
jgi:quercetin dioxygenase-like cupin family protein